MMKKEMKLKYIVVMAMFFMAMNIVVAGTWKMHGYYVSSNIQNIYDTDYRVYYLNSGHLFQFDKITLTTTVLSSQNLLSGDNINQIFYDYEKKLLFITYSDCNIDIIDADNKKTNVSTLRDAVVRMHNYSLDEKNNLSSYTESRINDITFHDGVANVATGFGYIAIDESTFRVIDNMFIDRNININSVAVLRDDLMMILSNTYCYYGPTGATDPIGSFKKYKKTAFTGGKIFPIDNQSAFVLALGALYHFDFSASNPVVTTLVQAKPTIVQKTPTGYIANFEGQKYYYTISSDGKIATKVSSSIGFASSNPWGNGIVWISDANGIHEKNSETFYKMNSLTTDQPYWLKYNTSMNLLYAGVSARNGITNIKETPNNVINIFDGNIWADATSYTANGAGYEFVFNPLDSTTYFRASWNRGIHKVTNNVMKVNYTSLNSLIGTYKAHPAFDKYGNMWVVSSYTRAADSVIYNGASMHSPPVAVLPKDKVLKNSVRTNDWFLPSNLSALNTGSMQRSRFVISKLNNYKIYTDGDFMSTGLLGRIMCWDNGSEDPTVDNYRFTSIDHFIDQDNRTLKWGNVCHMEEDSEGMIWVGHLSGVFAFDPNTVFDSNPKAIRPRVTNCDMEEDKGFLCEGQMVYDIGVDHDNNKWIATNNGLYFVSPDGTMVYDHFTTSNSDIPSNNVYSVECDTKHNRVYIYTDNGFAEYEDTDDAPSLNYSNIYVYPNPVDPDFTGVIRVSNLMDDTYLTIVSKDGSIVRQMGPVTGTARWDGCSSSGDWVPTGNYNIYVGQGGYPEPSSAPYVTVLIIR